MNKEFDKDQLKHEFSIMKRNVDSLEKLFDMHSTGMWLFYFKEIEFSVKKMRKIYKSK